MQYRVIFIVNLKLTETPKQKVGKDLVKNIIGRQFMNCPYISD